MNKIISLETTNKTMLFSRWNDSLQLSFKIKTDDLFSFKNSIDITIDKSGFIIEDDIKFKNKEVYKFIEDTIKTYGKEIYSSLKEIDVKAKKLIDKYTDDIRLINEIANKQANDYLDFMFNKYIKIGD